MHLYVLASNTKDAGTEVEGLFSTVRVAVEAANERAGRALAWYYVQDPDEEESGSVVAMAEDTTPEGAGWHVSRWTVKFDGVIQGNNVVLAHSLQLSRLHHDVAELYVDGVKFPWATADGFQPTNVRRGAELPGVNVTIVASRLTVVDDTQMSAPLATKPSFAGHLPKPDPECDQGFTVQQARERDVLAGLPGYTPGHPDAG